MRLIKANSWGDRVGNKTLSAGIADEASRITLPTPSSHRKKMATTMLQLNLNLLVSEATI
jgi:hypothetical protein